MAMLDRFLYSSQWEDNFPFSRQIGLVNQLSDHVSIYLDIMNMRRGENF